MAWFALGNLASALATGLPWLVATRFLTGLPHGAYFGVASLVAASLVAARSPGAGRRPGDAGADRRHPRGRPARDRAGPGAGLARRPSRSSGRSASSPARRSGAACPRRPADPSASPSARAGGVPSQAGAADARGRLGRARRPVLRLQLHHADHDAGRRPAGTADAGRAGGVRRRHDLGQPHRGEAGRSRPHADHRRCLALERRGHGRVHVHRARRDGWRC